MVKHRCVNFLFVCDWLVLYFSLLFWGFNDWIDFVMFSLFACVVLDWWFALSICFVGCVLMFEWLGFADLLDWILGTCLFWIGNCVYLWFWLKCLTWLLGWFVLIWLICGIACCYAFLILWFYDLLCFECVLWGFWVFRFLVVFLFGFGVWFSLVWVTVVFLCFCFALICWTLI